MADLRAAFFAMDSIISGPVYSTSMNPPGNMLSIRRSNNSLNDWDGVPKRADLHPLLTPYRSQFISKFIRLMFLSCTEDEYDNFANEVLMARQQDYEALLYGEGLLKTVFKAVKAAAGGQGLDRVFITGVSPVVLSDMTSGYNVGENIYLEPAFNDLCGFTEAEIAAVLARLAGEGAAWSPAEALDTMRTFYNGYGLVQK